ncbi:hypothetical protein VST7929_02998 [Vibrio stylophorae]|uniref:DUF3352 domain-containing protein n=1 Tax=Vibrio stylophorae TaxID=659351 RepID=A0ABM8ZXH4_9VIBR|nr:hypothetical protein [Vibrio stylophorae]CAH0535425.1 hypothetical protein VST7929_02998 [Vibrio stylophorae]
MKKNLIAASIFSGLLTLSGCATNQSEQQKQQILSYVPADTVLFIGQFEPTPSKALFNQYIHKLQTVDLEQFKQMLNHDVPAKGGQRFVVELANQLLENSHHTDQFMATLGLADETRSYFYLIGAQPVLKFEIEDAVAFAKFLDDAEEKSQYQHTKEVVGDTQVRRYAVYQGSQNDDLDLIIHLAPNMVTMTLESALLPSQLPMVLQQQAPTNSLLSSQRLEQIENQFALDSQSLGYIDHLGIVDALTGKTKNQLNQDIQTLVRHYGNEHDVQDFALIESTACQNELHAIFAKWPKTVMTFDYSDSQPIQSQARLIVESSHPTLAPYFQSMQGFIPSYTQQFHPLAIGFGLDINAFMDFYDAYGQAVTTPKFSCAIAQSFQKGHAEIKAQQDFDKDTEALALFADLRGVAGALFNYQVSFNSQNEIEGVEIDAIISLSSINIQGFYQQILDINPMLGVMLPLQTGKTTNISEHLPMIKPFIQNDVYAEFAGDHIVFYAGKNGSKQAKQLAKESAQDKNGYFSFAIHEAKLMAPLEAMGDEAKPLNDWMMLNSSNGYMEIKGTKYGMEILETQVYE